ncbi:MAG: flippase-like domain-containing protein [Lentisphaeria bacterium]|nr:flippase-like domain-containing protein [Lentisphaeria bacterium]
MTKNTKKNTSSPAQPAPGSAASCSAPDTPAPGGVVVFLKYAVKILVTAGIVAVLVYSSKKHGTFDGVDFSGLNWGWLGAAFLLYLVHLFVNAWRWRLLLAYRAIPCSLFSAFSLTTQSFFFSLVMPGGAIGGDVIRAGFLAYRVPKGQKFDGVFTILMDRFTGMIGIFLTVFLALPFAWRYLDGTDPRAKLLTFALLGASAAGLLAAVVIFLHRQLEKLAFFRWGEEFGARLTHGFSTKLLTALDSYSGATKEIVWCVIASILGVNLVLGLCFYCVCLAFSSSLAPLFAPIVAAITVGNIAGLIPLTMSGIGLRDYFVAAILGAAIAELPDCPVAELAPTLVMTGVIIAGGLFGGIFFLFDNPRKKQPPQAPAPPEE